jgi:hypothetical protein
MDMEPTNPKEEYQGKSVTEWLNLLESGHSEEQRAAVYACKAVGPAARRAAPVLCKLLVSPGHGIGRGVLVEALGAIGAADPQAVDLLIALGTGRAPDGLELTPMVQAQAIESVGALGRAEGLSEIQRDKTGAVELQGYSAHRN